jgi:hypothetical protein
VKRLLANFVFIVPATCVGQLVLPALNVFNYQPAARDPFISASAPTTLLNSTGDVRGVVSGDIVRKYLDTIITAIRENLYVGGVSIGDTPQLSEALINGVSFHYGDVLPLMIDQNQLSTLVELSRAYGLPLQVSKDGAISIQVGQIDRNGVSLVLPGFREALYQLPLDFDTQSSKIILERRPKQKPQR